MSFCTASVLPPSLFCAQRVATRWMLLHFSIKLSESLSSRARSPRDRSAYASPCVRTRISFARPMGDLAMSRSLSENPRGTQCFLSIDVHFPRAPVSADVEDRRAAPVNARICLNTFSSLFMPISLMPSSRPKSNSPSSSASLKNKTVQPHAVLQGSFESYGRYVCTTRFSVGEGNDLSFFFFCSFGPSASAFSSSSSYSPVMSRAIFARMLASVTSFRKCSKSDIVFLFFLGKPLDKHNTETDTHGKLICILYLLDSIIFPVPGLFSHIRYE